MAEVEMPQLGETVTEGTIIRWFKQVGETVAVDDRTVTHAQVEACRDAPADGVVEKTGPRRVVDRNRPASLVTVDHIVLDQGALNRVALHPTQYDGRTAAKAGNLVSQPAAKDNQGEWALEAGALVLASQFGSGSR